MQNNFEIVNKIHNSIEAIHWLDGADSLDFIQKCKQEMRKFCPVLPGQHVLDVGCGVGQEVHFMAEAVGASGRVVGIDLGESIIAEAKRRCVERKFAAEFQVGHAGGLSFADNCFDMSRAERVVEYVDDPAGMINEMARVVRPNGSVLLFDFDYRGLIVDASDQSLARRVNKIVLDSVPNPQIGAILPRLCREAGLVDVKVLPQIYELSFFVYAAMVKDVMADAIQAGELTTNEFEKWWGELEAAESKKQFFSVITGFIVMGRKPVCNR